MSDFLYPIENYVREQVAKTPMLALISVSGVTPSGATKEEREAVKEDFISCMQEVIQNQFLAEHKKFDKHALFQASDNSRERKFDPKYQREQLFLADMDSSLRKDKTIQIRDIAQKAQGLFVEKYFKSNIRNSIVQGNEESVKNRLAAVYVALQEENPEIYKSIKSSLSTFAGLSRGDEKNKVAHMAMDITVRSTTLNKEVVEILKEISPSCFTKLEHSGQLKDIQSTYNGTVWDPSGDGVRRPSI